MISAQYWETILIDNIIKWTEVKLKMFHFLSRSAKPTCIYINIHTHKDSLHFPHTHTQALTEGLENWPWNQDVNIASSQVAKGIAQCQHWGINISLGHWISSVKNIELYFLWETVGFFFWLSKVFYKGRTCFIHIVKTEISWHNRIKPIETRSLFWSSNMQAWPS